MPRPTAKAPTPPGVTPAPCIFSPSLSGRRAQATFGEVDALLQLSNAGLHLIQRLPQLTDFLGRRLYRARRRADHERYGSPDRDGNDDDPYAERPLGDETHGLTPFASTYRFYRRLHARRPPQQRRVELEELRQ